jgi:hypothetical protein
MEHYRELARLPSVQNRPADFKNWLKDAETAARDLETILRNAKEKTAGEQAERIYHRSRMLCSQCHGKYRDVPQTR